ncbi:MAG: PG0870-related protein, partial [Bacteroidales bacterium]
MDYKYKLEKYSSKSKHTCPSCGRAKCFTRYIDTESGQYINDNVGICDHKNSCGYHLPPKEYKVFNDLRDFKNFRPIQKKEIPICEIDP